MRVGCFAICVGANYTSVCAGSNPGSVGGVRRKMGDPTYVLCSRTNSKCS